MLIPSCVRFDNGICQRRYGAAFTGNLGCNALVNLRRKARLDKNRQLGLSQHVDEAGCNNQTVRIDGALGWSAGQISDCDDLAITNSDIARVPRRAGAIDDVSVDDYEVKRRGGLSECKVR
jgi:hypothetical protein